MQAQVITTEYADEFPVQPWAAVVRTAAGASAGAAGGGDAGADAVGFVPDAPVRKARDRGASAVEWVIITGIVIVIVLGVGAAIKTALDTKAKQTGTDITNATVSGD